MFEKLILAAVLSLTATVTFADPMFKGPPPAEGHSYPECYCTNRGVKVQVGQMTCLKVGGREFTARCGMSLNNPAWREVKDGCDDVLSQGLPRSLPVSELVEPG